MHNSLAGQVALELNLAGTNSTPVQHEISFETALWQARTELAQNEADLALAGAADELNAYHLAAGLRWGWWEAAGSGGELAETAQQGDGVAGCRLRVGGGSRHRRVWPGEGCALFSLARTGASTAPLAWVLGIRIGRASWGADGRIDAAAEARWIQETLARDGESLKEVDLLLRGANGHERLDLMYTEVAEALSRLRGWPIQVALTSMVAANFTRRRRLGS